MTKKKTSKKTDKPALAIEMWAISRPKPYDKNARKLSDKAVAKCANSIKEFGWQQPIVVDKKGVVIAGHTRLLAAQSLGLAEVPVHVAANLTPTQVRAYRLADNRTAQETSWDLDLLGPELLELQALDLDLSLTGFDADELKLYMLDATEGLTDPDDCPAPQAEAISALGDLWLLGEHRLLCGDSTSVDAVERLMAGEKAALMNTDPPYGVGYGVDSGPDSAKRFAPIVGDSAEGPELQKFLEDVFMSAMPFLRENAAWYLWHAQLTQGFFAAAAAAAAAQLLIHRQIIWSKSHFILGHGDYHWQHELCFYGWRQGNRPPWYGDRAQSTVWNIPNPRAAKDHPTGKPVELFLRPIEFHTKVGEICLEPFAGSGPQFIAAETTARRCFGLELSPHYVDCIIRRWQAFTGKSATLEDGRPFAELEAERSPKSVTA